MKIASIRIVIKAPSEEDHEELEELLTSMKIDFISAAGMLEFPIKKLRDSVDKSEAAFRMGKIVGLLCKSEVELLKMDHPEV